MASFRDRAPGRPKVALGVLGWTRRINAMGLFTLLCGHIRDTKDLLAVSYFCPAAQSGLAAIWAAISPGRRVIRVAVVALPLACLLVIPAYEPLLFFVIQWLIVGLGMKIGGTIQRRLNGNAMTAAPSIPAIRFSLATLMLGTVGIALLLMVVIRMPRHPFGVWQNLLLAGCTMGGGNIGGLLAGVFPGGWWWWRIPVAVLMAVLLAVPLACTDHFLLAFPDFRSDGPFDSSIGDVMPFVTLSLRDCPGGCGDSRGVDRTGTGVAT